MEIKVLYVNASGEGAAQKSFESLELARQFCEEHVADRFYKSSAAWLYVNGRLVQTYRRD